VGIEQNIADVGKKVAYNTAPKLDEAASAALLIAERGLDPMMAFVGKARRAGSMAMDIIDPQREDERAIREHLADRVGQVALIGSYHNLDPEAAQRTAHSLWRSGVIDGGSIIAVRPLIHREATAERLRLHQSAELLHMALVDPTYDLASIVGTPADAVRIHSRRSVSEPEAVHEAIYKADDEFGSWLNDYLNEHWRRDNVAPRSRTILIARPELSAVLNGVSGEDLEDGGAIVLAAARKHAKHRWLALERVAEPVHKAAPEEPAVETRGEMELDFEIKLKGERFKRGGNGQEAEHLAREGRIVTSEG
jgi:hypothetical protein